MWYLFEGIIVSQTNKGIIYHRWWKSCWDYLKFHINGGLIHDFKYVTDDKSIFTTPDV